MTRLTHEFERRSAIPTKVYTFVRIDIDTSQMRKVETKETNMVHFER
jgi:hypothetical protein